MVRARELRIGNYVLLNGEFVNIGYGYIGDLYQKQKGLINIYLDKLPIAEGIVLTPEILEKCGLDKMAGVYDYGKLTIVLPCNEYPKGRTYFNSWAILNSIPESLHQLQNLIHALTGEELTVNL